MRSIEADLSGRISGGFGIMLDDIIAGFMALLVLLLAETLLAMV